MMGFEWFVQVVDIFNPITDVLVHYKVINSDGLVLYGIGFIYNSSFIIYWYQLTKIIELYIEIIE